MPSQICLHYIIDNPYHDVLACDISLPNFVRTHRSPVENSQTDFSVLTLMRTLFNGSHIFILVEDFNADHADKVTPSCDVLPSSSDSRLVDLVKNALVFQYVREPTRHDFDAPPLPLLNIVLMKDDSDAFDMQLGDPLGLSDQFTFRFLVNWKPRISPIHSLKRPNHI